MEKLNYGIISFNTHRYNFWQICRSIKFYKIFENLRAGYSLGFTEKILTWGSRHDFHKARGWGCRTARSCCNQPRRLSRTRGSLGRTRSRWGRGTLYPLSHLKPRLRLKTKSLFGEFLCHWNSSVSKRKASWQILQQLHRWQTKILFFQYFYENKHMMILNLGFFKFKFKLLWQIHLRVTATQVKIHLLIKMLLIISAPELKSNVILRQTDFHENSL